MGIGLRDASHGVVMQNVIYVGNSNGQSGDSGIMIGPNLHNLRLDGQHFLPIAATLDGARIGLRAAYLG